MSSVHGRSVHIAIVGATGLVGRELVELLAERAFPCESLRLIASDRSAGKTMQFGDREVIVEPLDESSFDGMDVVFFAAGSGISREYAPIAAAAGALVIDNSSAFRVDHTVPLVIPEINGHVLNDWTLDNEGGGIIANPNCSTIIALMAVSPIHFAVGVKRMVVSTYQAASGGGATMLDDLVQQARQMMDDGKISETAIGRQYIFNLFSHDSPVASDGFNEEEHKMSREAHRIWDDVRVGICATCVRVPVLRAHSESINLTLAKALHEEDARDLLHAAPGVRVIDDRHNNRFPEPVDATGKDDVLVGRIRNDPSIPGRKGLCLFVSGDQLRKGAALNAIQIAERLVAHTPSEPEMVSSGAMAS